MLPSYVCTNIYISDIIRVPIHTLLLQIYKPAFFNIFSIFSKLCKVVLPPSCELIVLFTKKVVQSSLEILPSWSISKSKNISSVLISLPI